MVDVIGPTPGHEDADIQKECHGKSESSARTDSVVSGGWLSGAAKIIAPVCGQRTRRGLRETGSEALARRRRYSETLIPSFLARDRIRRASSSVTLNVIVVMVIRYYRAPGRVKRLAAGSRQPGAARRISTRRQLPGACPLNPLARTPTIGPQLVVCFAGHHKSRTTGNIGRIPRSVSSGAPDVIVDGL